MNKLDKLLWWCCVGIVIALVYGLYTEIRDHHPAKNKVMAERLVKFNPSLEQQYIKFLIDDNQISDEELKILMDKSGVNDE